MTAAPFVLIPSSEPADRVAAVARALGDVASVEVLPPDDAATRRDLLSRADVLFVFGWDVAPAEVQHLGRVRFVQSAWAGVDRIRIAGLAATRPGLVVSSGSGPNAAQVAEYAVGLYLDCAKRLSWRDRRMREGGWPQEVPGRRLAGSRVAVVGYGHIGRRVARVLAAMDVTVTAVNRSGRAAGLDACTLEGLRARIPSFDGFVLSLPLSPVTEGWFDGAVLAAMKDDAVLVNVGRGKVVDAAALHARLVARPSFFAGLDTWWRYPKAGVPRAQPAPFSGLENVVLSPHSAFLVPGTRDEMLAGAVANVRRFLAGAPVQNVVPVDELR